MNKDEVRRLLQRHPRRGYILFRVFYVGFIAASAVLICLKLDSIIFVSWGWIVLSFLLGAISLIAWYDTRDRIVMSMLVAEDPSIVYWTHASGPNGPDLERSVDDCTSLSLHLRIGRQFGVELPVPQMREFIAWLREKNPDICWGHYDPPSAPAKT